MNENQETTVAEPITGTVSEAFEPAEEPQLETPTGEEPTGGAPQEPTAPINLTAEQITASVREGLKQSQPAAPAKQWTQEELDKAFDVWQPNQEVVDQLLAGGEGALKALLTMREGMSKQFSTLLTYSIEVAKKELQGQFAPALTFAQETAAAKDREAFFAANEDLKPHEKLTQTVFNALKAEGYRAATTAEAFKTLADRTRALLPTNGNGTGATQTGGARTATTTKRPASLSSGSQAGGGGHSAPVAPFAGAEIWSE